MSVCLLYTTVTNGPLTAQLAQRFVDTYRIFGPGAEHDTVIICNGGPASEETGQHLKQLPNVRFFPRANEGYDIGGYIQASRDVVSAYDLVLCMGESVFFHRPGWLKRLLEAYTKNGEGFYGFYSSNLVRTHCFTTAFAADPERLVQFPYDIASRDSRYNFEHGVKSFWRWEMLCGRATVLVTWDGDWLPEQWRLPANIVFRGDQSNCLFWCNHTLRYQEANEQTKLSWGRWADQPYS